MVPDMHTQEVNPDDDGFLGLRGDHPLETDYRDDAAPNERRLQRAAASAGIVVLIPAIVLAAANDFAGPGPVPGVVYLSSALLPLLLLLAAGRYSGARGLLAPLAIVAALLLGGVTLELAGAQALPVFMLVMSYTLFLFGLHFQPILVTNVLQVAVFGAHGILSHTTVANQLPELVVLCLFTVMLSGLVFAVEHQRRAAFLGRHALALQTGRDALTRIANRRGFDAQLRRSSAHCLRERTPLTLVLVDVDHFEDYKGYYGQAAADRCLVKVAALLDERCRRPLDVAARLDGGQFALLLPGCGLAQGREIADGLRRGVIAAVIENAASPTSALLTVSAGVAELDPGGALPPELLLARAGEALARARADGHNRVACDDMAGAADMPDNVVSLSDARKRSSLRA